ncbi:MAG: Dyp-type peroxidase [Actinomycetota bacterium]
MTGPEDDEPVVPPAAGSSGTFGPPGRRRFLAGAGAVALAGLAAACTEDTDRADGAGNAAGGGGGAVAVDPALAEAVPYRADRQLGVLRPPMAAGAVAAFDVADGDRARLVDTMAALGAEIERIMAGGGPVDADEILPPPDTGLIEPAVGTAGTSITVGVGASLFDDRFGLADRRPAELIPMPRFFNDRLVRPEWSDGDLALLISSPTPQATVYALQQAVRVTAPHLRLRWVQEGYNDLLPPEAGAVARTRNLMGFRDGTSNPDTEDQTQMDEHVWVQPGDPEPAWAVGGTYLAVRVIRMLIEFWGTAALVRQEQIFGRHRDTGAPLGQEAEAEEPRFATDPSDLAIPPASHVRRANPRTPGTRRILRRGFSYLNGVDPSSGTLDQGLLFLAFQRSLSQGFLLVQQRLDGEPMEDYVKPVGGGLFFVPPGPGSGDGPLLGELLA